MRSRPIGRVVGERFACGTRGDIRKTWLDRRLVCQRAAWRSSETGKPEYG